MLIGQDVFNKTITIEPQMYTQNYEHFKRLVLDSPDSEAEYIDGFDFEWGYSYTLSVKVKDIGQLSDGTRYDYALLSVKSKVKVPDSVTFLMSVDPLRYYDKISEEALDLWLEEELDWYVWDNKNPMRLSGFIFVEAKWRYVSPFFLIDAIVVDNYNK